VRAALDDDHARVRDRAVELLGGRRRRHQILVAGDDRRRHIDRRQHLICIVLVEPAQKITVDHPVDALKAGGDRAEDLEVDGLADEAEPLHRSDQRIGAREALRRDPGERGLRTHEPQQHRDRAPDEPAAHHGAERVPVGAVDEVQPADPRPVAPDRLERDLHAHRPAREHHRPDALGVEDLDQVVDLMDDRVRGRVARRAGGVEPAVVPAHDAVTLQRSVEVLEREVRAAEAVGEHDARPGPTDLVADAGAVARREVALLDPRNHAAEIVAETETGRPFEAAGSTGRSSV
jgi:hypothetical protein